MQGYPRPVFGQYPPPPPSKTITPKWLVIGLAVAFLAVAGLFGLVNGVTDSSQAQSEAVVMDYAYETAPKGVSGSFEFAILRVATEKILDGTQRVTITFRTTNIGSSQETYDGDGSHYLYDTLVRMHSPTEKIIGSKSTSYNPGLSGKHTASWHIPADAVPDRVSFSPDWGVPHIHVPLPRG